MVFHVAEDLTLRDGVVHRGVACNHCKATPIKGIRYKCANCPDFDLCADCELQEVHNPKHVFIKLNNVVPPRLNPRKPLCPQLFPGTAQPKQKILWESLKNLEAFFNLSRSTITAYFSEFQLVADSSDPPGVSPARFRELMGEYAARPNLIVDRLFFLFDRDGDGIVGFADMLGTMAVLEHGSYDEKMRLAFRGMDLDQRGHLVPDDLIAILRAFLELTVLQVTDLVSGLQSEMVQSLDDAGSKPVSALFTAPIGLPSDTPPTKGADAAMHLDQHDWTPTPTHAASSLHATPELSSKGGDAVVMFVNRIFNNRDRMDLAEFEHTARVHPLLVTWVTSLGTIF
ncbi:hypothetical protein PTSG_10998 [Salpingoeca rosetta]|uniref:ZZ-type domain-containing protein n=1 Tax=Salpingoeca rosetta (strain ATCC 50818 / BSB-021) TaxID=946362 RepID=F2USE5_SALR5|nr:uncharacterized protein PTSG_10998 [Salpingoeca rosetta]EGD81054.1 hypothetical protein PTSG_10998 [Salpingoeca rosetta]|eukprot:XP_004987924.1 hypothetical protein PTSG_10998 [Salpingoeca rosetta]